MRAFVDTNVLAYRLDSDEPAKRTRAAEWLERDVELRISTQILVELHSVLTRRFGLPRDEAATVLDAVGYDTVPTDRGMVMRAVETASSHQLSIFDALVVEAAALEECDELWTEDLADGSTLRGVRIVNPFAGIVA